MTSGAQNHGLIAPSQRIREGLLIWPSYSYLRKRERVGEGFWEREKSYSLRGMGACEGHLRGVLKDCSAKLGNQVNEGRAMRSEHLDSTL